MKKDLPIFDIIVNEEDLSQGVGRISLVDEPAIGVDWITLRKQPKMMMAKRECLGCPPNGDGTRVNGEPDGRCKGDGGGKGGDKAPKGGAGKTPSAKSTGLDRKGANDLVLEIEKNGSIKVDDNLRSFIESSNGMTMTSANGVISNSYELRPDAKNPDVKNIILTQKNNSRGDSFFTKIGSFNSTSGSLTLGASDFAPNYMIAFLTTENKNFKKQTFAKRECLGCPPNGDGTTAKGEPDRRCKGDGAGKTGGAGKTPKASTSETQKNNIPESADTYNDIPSSEWSKEVDTNSLPTPTNSHERYMNAIMTDPESIYLDPPASKTLQDAIGRYGSATGPNGQEVLVVDWAKKLKFK